MNLPNNMTAYKIEYNNHLIGIKRQLRITLPTGYERVDNSNIRYYYIADRNGTPRVLIGKAKHGVFFCRGYTNTRPTQYVPQIITFIIRNNFNIVGDIGAIGIVRQHNQYYNIYDLPNGFVFHGDMDLHGCNMQNLPNMESVSIIGNFNCSDNKLTNYNGAPRHVSGNFYAYNNTPNLLHQRPGTKIDGKFYNEQTRTNDTTTLYAKHDRDSLCVVIDGVTFDLNHLPPGFVITGDLNLASLGLTKLPNLSDITIDGSFTCDDNPLTSLDGSPKHVTKNYNVRRCALTSLRGITPRIDGELRCDHNKLTDYYGPDYIGGNIRIIGNPGNDLSTITPNMWGNVKMGHGHNSNISEYYERRYAWRKKHVPNILINPNDRGR